MVTRNPNAPVYAIIYCSITVYSNIIQLVPALLGDAEELSGNDMTSVVRSLLWGIVWILYFIMSTQVQELFPKENRKLPNPVLLITVALALAPLVLFFMALYIGLGMG